MEGVILNKYEELLQDASDDNVRVYESFDLNGNNEVIEKIDGLYIDGNIALDKDLKTTAERACVLAEELGHHYTSSGNIIDMNSLHNRKQERQARLHGYNRMIGLYGIISAFKAGCQNAFEVAEHLHITEDYLQECIKCYREKYGVYTTIDNYVIYFIPNLAVGEHIDI